MMYSDIPRNTELACGKQKSKVRINMGSKSLKKRTFLKYMCVNILKTRTLAKYVHVDIMEKGTLAKYVYIF